MCPRCSLNPYRDSTAILFTASQSPTRFDGISQTGLRWLKLLSTSLNVALIRKELVLGWYLIGIQAYMQWFSPPLVEIRALLIANWLHADMMGSDKMACASHFAYGEQRLKINCITSFIFPN